MNIKGRKSYSVTLKLPKEIQNPRVKDIREMFQEACRTVINANHRADVKTNRTTRGTSYIFTVAFGSKQPNDLILYSIIKELVQGVIWRLLSKSYQDKASSLLLSCVERYEDNCFVRPIQHISVKPNGRIKLC